MGLGCLNPAPLTPEPYQDALLHRAGLETLVDFMDFGGFGKLGLGIGGLGDWGIGGMRIEDLWDLGFAGSRVP